MLDVYAICGENCKHLTYTREQFLALLKQAIENGTLQGINPEMPTVEKLKEIRAGNTIKFWMGTEAQFNELGIEADDYTSMVLRVAADGTVYICTNDITLTVMDERFKTIEKNIEGIKKDYTPKSTIHAVTIAAWEETMNVTVSGVTATSPVEILPGDGITADQLKALQRANIVDGGGQKTGTVSIKLLGAIPTISIPVKFIVRGDM